MSTINYKNPTLAATLLNNGTMLATDKQKIDDVYTAIDGYAPTTYVDESILAETNRATAEENLIKSVLDGYSGGSSTDGYATVIYVDESILAETNRAIAEENLIKSVLDGYSGSAATDGYATVIYVDESILAETNRAIAEENLIKSVLDGYSGSAATDGYATVIYVDESILAETNRAIAEENLIKSVLDGYSGSAATDGYATVIYVDESILAETNRAIAEENLIKSVLDGYSGSAATDGYATVIYVDESILAETNRAIAEENLIKSVLDGYATVTYVDETILAETNRAIAEENLIKSVLDGYVEGPESSTPTTIAVYDGYTGKVIKTSLVTIDGYGNINLPNGKITNVNSQTFQILNGDTVSYQEGTIYYDTVEKALSVMMDIPDVRLQLGYENYIRIYNGTGSIIDNGKVVYVSGVQGNRPTASLISANELDYANLVIGVSTHDIGVGEEGLITTFGVVRGIDTRDFADAACLYVHPTIPGELTTTIPGDGYAKIKVAVSLNTTVNGSIMVCVKDVRKVEYLDDVWAGAPTDGYYLLGDGTWWKGRDFATDVFGNIGSLTNNPTGFPITGGGGLSTLSKVDGTRTFTITPVGVSYDIWVRGVKFTKTVAENVVWPDVEGIHIFYFDTDSILSTTQDSTTISNVILGDGCIVAGVYWDATNNIAVSFADERHGLQMDGATHLYLHRTVGAKYVSGGALANFSVDGTGNNATDAQFAVENVIFYDEDLIHDSSTSSQVLSLPAQIPIVYRNGANGDWRLKTSDTYPLIYSGTAGYTGVSGLPAYNQWTGAVWQLTEVSNNQYFLMHYYATSNITQPIIGIVGQAIYGSALSARTGAEVEISSLQGTIRLLAQEATPLGTVIFQVSVAYGNVPKARIRSTEDGSSYVDFRSKDLVGAGSEIIYSFSDDLFRIYDNVDSSKQVAFELSGITTGTTRTITIPDRSFTLGTDGYAIHNNVAGEIAAIANKPSPVSGDYLLIEDSASANAKKQITIGALPFIGGIAAGASSKSSGVVSFADSNGVSFGINSAGIVTASTASTVLAANQPPIIYPNPWALTGTNVNEIPISTTGAGIAIAFPLVAAPYEILNICTISSVILPINIYGSGAFTNAAASYNSHTWSISGGLYSLTNTTYTLVASTSFTAKIENTQAATTGAANGKNWTVAGVSGNMTFAGSTGGATSSLNYQLALNIGTLTLQPGKYLFATMGFVSNRNTINAGREYINMPLLYGKVADLHQGNSVINATAGVTVAAVNGIIKAGAFGLTQATSTAMPASFALDPSKTTTAMPFAALI
jgi:RNA-binding protein YhbY